MPPTANIIGHFPSGQPILPVLQADRTPKLVFVLGVYASAVHARWRHPDGRTRIAALAVASEPEIARLGAHSDKWATLHAEWQTSPPTIP